ncbi:uncharacterized protein LOC8023313 isoform X2 [Ixodes scapularis]|uniref:uncharacterized protein LOC8023313 isoform X2 n=1 Tax=Ixodes scapularis TaxID=6945 RepID=UPI001C392110|nr:uncharacterized protein LOC8023313 isoform X2 [Ixodes scapularis]
MAQQERYQSLVKFRQAVFSKDKIASESSQFHYSDVVKALMNDRAEEQLQINLMLMLQEGSNDFLTKMTTYEAVESLKSCFSQLKRTSRYNLQSHILVTVTSILLNADASDDTQLSEFVELLVESVVQVKRNHPLVRSTGCNCLREIEFFFPGTIAKHLDELWGALAKDTSWASQALAQLVALALGTLEGSCRSGLHDVPVLLSQLPLMTPMTAGTLLRSLLAVAQDTNALPPGVVKMCSSQYTLCYELPLAHFVLTAEEQPPMEALEHLRRALTSAHAGCRGLVLSWLGSSLRRLGTHELAQGSRWSLALLPAPGADAQLQGLQLQAALADGLATASAPEEALATVVVHLRSFGRWAAAVPSRFPLQLLLHILYRLYADSRESALASSVDEELSRLVVNMTMLPPFYCRSLLSFLSCIEVKFPDSMLPESVLAQAVETVAQPSRAQCLEAGLESSLLVLGVAVQRPVHVFKPKLVFRYIQRLVSSRGLSARRTWLLGNQLIDLCCSIMLYQAPDSLSSELRGVLCYLMESSEDVDVQSRAKLLYAALYALSESKVGEAAAAAVLQRPGEGQGAGLQHPLIGNFSGGYHGGQPSGRSGAPLETGSTALFTHVHGRGRHVKVFRREGVDPGARSTGALQGFSGEALHSQCQHRMSALTGLTESAVELPAWTATQPKRSGRLGRRSRSGNARLLGGGKRYHRGRLAVT